MEYQSHHCHQATHSGFQQHNRDSSSTQSTEQSHHEVTAMGRTSSQDQCVSSESVRVGSYGKQVESQMNPAFFTGNPDFVANPSQIDFSKSFNRVSYPYADPYYGPFLTAYGPQPIIHPQMLAMAPARVPLPLDLAEDGAVYVNAKQYHGIVRRRQIRAKLEAQNKLAKTRRPYLHESRHQHALNRVRGSGGRFLSKKQLQKPDPTPGTGSQRTSESAHSCQKRETSPQFEAHQSETSKYGGSLTSFSGISGVTSGDIFFQPPDHGFAAISPRPSVSIRDTGGLMSNGTEHRAPVVR